jgi:hypothetical protein
MGCATTKNRQGQTICNHILTFYPKIAGNPIIFWILSTEHLKEQHSEVDLILEQSPSHTGDICHINLKGISDNKARKYFKKFCKPPYLVVCEDMEPVQLNTVKKIQDYIDS